MLTVNNNRKAYAESGVAVSQVADATDTRSISS
jgi:hypothetical protein